MEREAELHLQGVVSGDDLPAQRKTIGERMTPEDKAMADAALLLEEKINDRVIAALRNRVIDMDEIIMDSLLRSGRYNSSFQGLIVDCLKERIR